MLSVDKLISFQGLPSVKINDAIWSLSFNKKKLYRFFSDIQAAPTFDKMEYAFYAHGPLLDETVFHLTIVLTNDCNLNCQYCSLGTEKYKEEIDIEKTKRFLENLFQKLHQHTIIVSFFGGEPTIKYEKMEQFCAFLTTQAKLYKKKIKFTMTTNGTYNSSVENIILRYGFSVLYSMDGPEEIQNVQRSHSYDIVVKNLKRLLAQNVSVTVSCVVTRFSVLKWQETADFFLGLGVKELQYNPVFPSEDSLAGREQNLLFTRPNVEEYVSSAFSIYTYGIERGVSYSNPVFSRLFKPCRYYCDLQARHQAILVNYNGDIMNCAEVQNPSHPLYQQSKLGAIDNIVMADIFQTPLCNTMHQECKVCPLKTVCCGGCRKRALLMNQEVEIDLFNCEMYRMLVAEYIQYLAMRYMRGAK